MGCKAVGSMSAPVNDGGTAFPILERGGSGLELTSLGMTLRDYFAARLMASLCDHTTTYTKAAQEAYEAADAMLEARK